MLKIIAVVILILFYGCYFSKMIVQKRKGIQTDQIGKGKTGFVKFVELTMKVVTIAVPIIEVLSIFVLPSLSPNYMQYAGVAIGILGVLIFICSVVTMKDSWRAGVPETDKTELVTNGIYRFSRNPAFLGFDLVYLGILLMYFNWLLFAASVLAMLMFHLQIVNVEEDFLLLAFGDEYLNYKKEVNRYIGRRRKKDGENK